MYDREYEYVTAIAREGTLSAAATSLGVSQPALTHFLKREEGELGTALFQRIGNRMVLTYAGECYMENVQQILAIQNRMRATIQSIARTDLGRLRIGIPSIRRSFTIFAAIPPFKEKYPSIEFSLSEQSSSVLEDSLENLELDCIAVNVSKQRDVFDYMPVAQERYVLAVHRDSPLLRSARPSVGLPYPVLPLRALEGAPLILLGKSHRIRQFSDSVLEYGKIGGTVAMNSRTLNGALEAVASDLGCTFAPDINLDYIPGGENIRYLSLDVPGVEYEFCLLTRRGAYLPPSTRDFMEMFRDAYVRARKGI